jgi:transcriptional regulator with XRE-family HTH domain
MTQEALAWASNIPKPHLSRIEGGESLPSIPVVFALAKELGVEAMDLVAFDLRQPRVQLLDAARRNDRAQVREALRLLGLA